MTNLPDQGNYMRALHRAREARACNPGKADAAVFIVRRQGEEWIAETPETWAPQRARAIGLSIAEALGKLALELETSIDEDAALSASGSIEVPEGFIP